MTQRPFELTPELVEAVQAFFERIPFNRLLGIQIDSLSEQRVLMSLPEFLGGGSLSGLMRRLPLPGTT